MSVVACELEHLELDGDHRTVAGVQLVCSRCGHSTESFGQSESSVNRCLALLREECPEGEATST